MMVPQKIDSSRQMLLSRYLEKSADEYDAERFEAYSGSWILRVAIF